MPVWLLRVHLTPLSIGMYRAGKVVANVVLTASTAVLEVPIEARGSNAGGGNARVTCLGPSLFPSEGASDRWRRAQVDGGDG